LNTVQQVFPEPSLPLYAKMSDNMAVCAFVLLRTIHVHRNINR
jgi:hypothetical protein